MAVGQLTHDQEVTYEDRGMVEDASVDVRVAANATESVDEILTKFGP